jgi:imidazolonepropionase-like amidohydrolase
MDTLLQDILGGIALYVPQLQQSQPTLTLVVRTRTEPAAVIETVRREILPIDPEQAVFNFATMDEVLAKSFAAPRRPARPDQNFGSNMKRLRSSIVLAFALAVSVTSAFGEDARTLTARWVLDVERGEMIENGVIVVSGDRIAAVGRKGEVAPKGEEINLGESTLMPGMIDAHVHLNLGGAGEANARATLKAGFTTVQDLGALNYENIKIGNAIRDGKFPGPRVISSGPWIGVAGGTCDFKGIGVKGADAFRERVRKDVTEGADLIKVCAAGWLAEAAEKPDAYEISDDELRAAIEEAHALKRRVAVHALSERAIAASVEHGADLIAHGGFTSKATVAAMARRRIYQLPTLFSLKGSAPPALYEKLRGHLSAAVRDGLPMAFGTDAGVIRHGENAKEFAELAAIGLTPPQVIRAATIDAAAAVGLADKTGVLKPGMYADIIAVEGNPLVDLDALQKVKFVMQAGRVVPLTK